MRRRRRRRDTLDRPFALLLAAARRAPGAAAGGGGGGSAYRRVRVGVAGREHARHSRRRAQAPEDGLGERDNEPAVEGEAAQPEHPAPRQLQVAGRRREAEQQLALRGGAPLRRAEQMLLERHLRVGGALVARVERGAVPHGRLRRASGAGRRGVAEGKRRAGAAQTSKEKRWELSKERWDEVTKGAWRGGAA